MNERKMQSMNITLMTIAQNKKTKKLLCVH